MHGFSAEVALNKGIGRNNDHTRHLINVINSLSDASSDSEGREKHRQALEKRFELTQQKLQATLKSRANELNKTVNSFQTISENIYESCECVSRARANLSACKEQLKCKREELKRLYEESREHDKVLEILDRIDELSKVPDIVAEHVKSNHFLHAAQSVSQAVYIFESLSDILVLQNMYSVDELKEQVYNKIMEKLEEELYHKPTKLVKQFELTPETAGKGVYKQLMLANKKSDATSTCTEPSSKNSIDIPLEPLDRDPSDDSYLFISLLVEALLVLNKVSSASLLLESNFNSHLDDLLFICTSEVLSNPSIQVPQDAIKLLFESILQRIKTIVSVQNVFIHRMNIANARLKGNWRDVYSLKSFLDIFQSVMKFLIQRYMTDNSSPTMRMNNTVDALHVGYFYSSKKPAGPEKPKELFSFKNSFESKKDSSTEQTNVSTLKLVCVPEYRNITKLYDPVVSLCSYIRDQLGVELENCDLYISLVKCVEDLFVDSVHKSVRDALTVSIPRETLRSVQDSPKVLSGLSSSKPLHRSVISAFEQLQDLVNISRQLPAFSSIFQDMCVDFLSEYQKIIKQWFSDIFGRQPNLCLSGRLLDYAQLRDAMMSNPSWSFATLSSSVSDTDSVLTVDNADNIGQIPRESLLIYDYMSKCLVTRSDIISDTNFVHVLSNFHHSFSWFYHKVTPDLLSIGDSPVAMQILEDIQKISHSCLIGLHVELRILCFYYFVPLLKEGRFKNICDSLDTDSEVNEFCLFISTTEATMEKFLPTLKLRYVFEGISSVISLLFINHAIKLGYISTSGLDRILRNLSKIKLTLRGVLPIRDVELDRVISFYENLHHPPDELVNIAIERGIQFSEYELKIMLDLSSIRFSTSTSGAASSAQSGDKLSRQLDRLKVIMKKFDSDGNLSRAASMKSVHSNKSESILI